MSGLDSRDAFTPVAWSQAEVWLCDTLPSRHPQTPISLGTSRDLTHVQHEPWIGPWFGPWFSTIRVYKQKSASYKLLWVLKSVQSKFDCAHRNACFVKVFLRRKMGIIYFLIRPCEKPSCLFPSLSSGRDSRDTSDPIAWSLAWVW